MKNIWMVRAGKDAFLIDEFKKRNIVALDGVLVTFKIKVLMILKELYRRHILMKANIL